MKCVCNEVDCFPDEFKITEDGVKHRIDGPCHLIEGKKCHCKQWWLDKDQTHLVDGSWKKHSVEHCEKYPMTPGEEFLLKYEKDLKERKMFTLKDEDEKSCPQVGTVTPFMKMSEARKKWDDQLRMVNRFTDEGREMHKYIHGQIDALDWCQKLFDV